MMMVFTLTLLVSLLSIGAQVTESDPSLDSLRCMKFKSHQLNKQNSIIKQVSYDLVSLIFPLLRVKRELEKTSLEVYPAESNLIEVQTVRDGLLLGRPVLFTRVNNSLVNGLPGDSRLLLDIIRLVADSERNIGLCLIEGVEVNYLDCRSTLKASWDAIQHPKVLPPDFNVSPEQLYSAQVMFVSNSELSWSEPGENIPRKYLVQRDFVSDLLLQLRKIVDTQLQQMISSLDSFIIYGKQYDSECNYFLLAILLREKGLTEGSFKNVTGDVRSAMLTECRSLSSELHLKRAGRSLLSWLLTDHSKILGELINQQHTAVTNEKILENNQRKLAAYSKILAGNMGKLAETQANNSLMLLDLIQENSIREQLYNTRIVMRSEKLSLVSYYRDINAQISLLTVELREMLQRLTQELGPQEACSLDMKGRGMACSEDQSFIDNLYDGQLNIASNGFLFDNKEVTLISCLFLDSDRFGHGRIFKGNLFGYVLADSYLHHKNLSIPLMCFSDVDNPVYRCDKYIEKFYPGGNVKPPLERKFFFYLLGPDFVFIQAKSALTLNYAGNKHIPVAQKPFLVKREQFPIFVNGDKYSWAELSEIETVSSQTAFLINNIDSEYFFFQLPSLSSVLTEGNLADHWLELEELMALNPVVKTISIAGAVLLGLIVIICVLTVYFCCRRRSNQTRLYQTYIRRLPGAGPEHSAQSPPSVPPKPDHPIGASNRNQKRTWMARLRNKKNAGISDQEASSHLMSHVRSEGAHITPKPLGD